METAGFSFGSGFKVGGCVDALPFSSPFCYFVDFDGFERSVYPDPEDEVEAPQSTSCNRYMHESTYASGVGCLRPLRNMGCRLL